MSGRGANLRAPFYEHDPFLGEESVISYPLEAHMPGTAVVRLYTGDGFIIAADGLRRDLSGAEVSNRQQKIFKIGVAGNLFAYALTGTTYVAQSELGFDVSLEAANVAATLSLKGYDSPDRYTEQFGRLLRASLRRGQKDRRIKEFSDSGTSGEQEIVPLLFAGYYGGRPFMSGTTLCHKDQEIQFPTRESRILSPSSTRLELSGSEKVRDLLLSTDDDTFAEYRTAGWVKMRIHMPLSLAEGADLARAYIAACASPKGRTLDVQCAAIGGRVHVAEITPAGFTWIDPP